MNLRALVSVFSISCLLTSSVFGGQLPAASGPDDAIHTSALIGRAAGTITDSGLTHSNRLVINIQDLHGHPEVQRNIARILADLEKRFLLTNIYVEGGCGPLDTSWLCNIENDDLRNDIVENLVDQGLLTGGEYYSVQSKRPFLLQGIEDEAVHKQNIVRLGALLARQPAVERKLAELEADLTLMKARHFSRQSRRFDTIATRFASGARAPEKYYAQLARYAAIMTDRPGHGTDAGVLDMERYPNITRYCTAARAGRRIDHAKTEREFAQFTRALRTLVPFGEYQSFLTEIGDRTDWDRVAERCAAMAKRYPVAVDRFPHLREFFAWAALNAGINPIQLIQEQATLERHIRIALARDRAEADIAFLATYFPLFKDFLLRRVSAEQHGFVTDHRAAFQAAWADYARFSSVEDLNDDYSMASAFHAANVRRNALFLRHLPVRDRPNAEAVVIITGGFHSDGLKSLLVEQGISFMLITPAVTTETSSASHRYAARAMQQAAAIARHAMQLALASQAAAQDKFRFCVSAAQKHLRDVPFNRENIGALVTQLRGIVGDEQLAVSIDEEHETASIAFADGKTITLHKNALTDTISTAGVFAPGTARAPEMTKEVLRLLAATLKAEIVTAEALVGLVPLIAGTSGMFNRLVAFAARHGLVYGNGYTLELKNDEHLRGYINTRLGLIAALLPAVAQQSETTRAQRELRVAAGSHTQLLQSVMAVDMLYDFLISVGAFGQKPVPVLLNTTLAWADFRQADIVSIPRCPVCGSHNSAPVGTVVINGKALGLGQCQECEMIWYSTRPPVSFYQDLYGPEYFGYDGQGLEPHGQTDATIDVGIRKHPKIEDIARREVGLWKRFLPAAENPDAPMRGRRIVEAGPGGGHLLIEAQRQGADVFGVDISEFIIEQLRNNGISGAVGELQQAGLAPGSVDGLAAYDLVEHVFDLDLFLDTVFTMLKPGGFLFIRTPDTGGNTPYLHLIDHVMHFSQKTLTDALQRHGFSVVYAQPSGPFEGPDGKMIDNMTVFAQKPVVGNEVSSPILPERSTPIPDPRTKDIAPSSLTPESMPDAETLEAILSAA